MRATLLGGLLVAFLLPAANGLAQADKDAVPIPLRQAAASRGLRIGTASAAGFLGDPAYTALLLREFSQIEAENDMKFGPIHPEPERYAFDHADALLQFGLKNKLQVRGHTLVWHNQNPDWVTKGTFTPAQLREVLHEHIQTVVSRYAGKLHAWDVVNEAFAEDGTLRSTVWSDQPGIGLPGTGYIEQAFRWARQADPKAELYYNDFNTENGNAKSDAIYAMVQDFKARKVPIDGVGFQFHITPTTDLSGMEANFRRFAELGLKLQITELDVRLPVDQDGKASAADLELQARVYGSVFATAAKFPACTAIQMWGLTDRQSWVPHFFKNTGAALPFDQDGKPKPAHRAIVDALTAPR